MTITYSLAPEPIWYIVNTDGTAAGGAYMYTRSSLNKVVDKPVYKDPYGQEAWPNPIPFGLNGTQGPFYWVSNSADPLDNYYIFVNDSDSNLLWDQDNFNGGGSGGGGGGNLFLPLENYINNNQFIDHIDDTASPIGLTNLVIAPSNHKGFTSPEYLNLKAGTNGFVGPDIRFVANLAGTPPTDKISFPLFALASAPLTGDVTPVDYVRYQCTGAGIGEQFKAFQFPVTQKVKNLSNQKMTFVVWAAVTSTPVDISMYTRQYFGSAPTSSTEAWTLRGTTTLTTTWTPWFLNFTMPDVAGGSLGTPNAQTDDDAVYIQLQMPLNQLCDVLFTKPQLYLGTLTQNKEFQSYDQINSINSTPRTGDIRTSLTSAAPKGWVAMNDGSIGNIGSGATTRANQDTFQLFSTIYTSVSDTYAPVSGTRTAPGNTVAAAITDFLLGKRLTLPLSLGRAMAGAGSGSGLTARALGSNTGAETISISAMPAHNHPGSTAQMALTPVQSGAGAFVLTSIGSSAITIASQGGGAADGNMEPTSFFNVFIKL